MYHFAISYLFVFTHVLFRRKLEARLIPSHHLFFCLAKRKVEINNNNTARSKRILYANHVRIQHI